MIYFYISQNLEKIRKAMKNYKVIMSAQTKVQNVSSSAVPFIPVPDDDYNDSGT
jgi:hypothetical protein